MKTNNKFLMLAAVVAAITVGACAAQPPQQCQVAQGVTNVIGLPQFWVQYKLVSGSGSCSMLTGDEIGFQSYINPMDDSVLSIAIRASALGTTYANGRVDPMDPDGKKINSVPKVTPFPDADYVCKNDGAVPEAVQNFQEETVDLDDGGTETIPATTVKYAWSDTRWLSSPSIPGQVFDAKLAYTEDGCTSTYTATGIWPGTICVTDADCDPLPLPDAGFCDFTNEPPGGCPNDQITDVAAAYFLTISHRIAGSGLNPSLKLKCDRNAGFYHPFVDPPAPYGACVLAESFDELVARTKP